MEVIIGLLILIGVIIGITIVPALMAPFFMALNKQKERANNFTKQLASTLDTPGVIYDHGSTIVGKHRSHSVMIKYICGSVYTGEVKEDSTIILFLQVWDYKEGLDGIIVEIPEITPDLSKLKEELHEFDKLEDIKFNKHILYITITLPLRPKTQNANVFADKEKNEDDNKIDVSDIVKNLGLIINKAIDFLEAEGRN